MNFYAILNTNGICDSKSQLSGVVDNPQMIEITEEQYADIIWREYTDGVWSTEKYEPDPGPLLPSPE